MLLYGLGTNMNEMRSATVSKNYGHALRLACSPQGAEHVTRDGNGAVGAACSSR
jgi:hypothetical protein